MDYPLQKDVILSKHYIAAISVLTVLSVSIVWLRMYSRIFVSRNLWWDDWTMFAASLVTIATNAFLMSAYHYGLGRHIYYLNSSQLSNTFKWLWAAEPTNLFAVYLVRLSISLFFLRLVPPKKAYKRLIWSTIVALTVSDIFISINYFFQCRPLRKVWEPHTPGTCFPDGVTAAATWLYQAVSIIADIILLAIPVVLFWRLQVPMRTKLALITLCCLGIFTCVCAVVKTALLPNLLNDDPDKTWIIAQLCLWAPMELCVGMICGTIPTLRPLLSSNPSSGRNDPSQRYNRFDSPFELDASRKKSHHTSSSDQPSMDVGSAVEISSSTEQIIAPSDQHRIQRKIEIEVRSTEAGDTTKLATPGEGSQWSVV